MYNKSPEQKWKSQKESDRVPLSFFAFDSCPPSFLSSLQLTDAASSVQNPESAHVLNAALFWAAVVAAAAAGRILHSPTFLSASHFSHFEIFCL